MIEASCVQCGRASQIESPRGYQNTDFLFKNAICDDCVLDSMNQEKVDKKFKKFVKEKRIS